jgi:hypothetical protein
MKNFNSSIDAFKACHPEWIMQAATEEEVLETAAK